MDKIWLSNPLEYCEVSNESRKYILYPKLKEIIEEFYPSTLFDYGSGDGSFINSLKPTFEVGVYDISKKAIALAKKNIISEVHFFNSKSSIPSNHYDVVVFSLVLMTIPTKESINSTLREIKRIKKNTGQFVIAITHPCFREQKFSSFQTNFNNSNYFSEGKKFQVTLKDLISQKKIIFYDYHWSLSFTINTIIANDFTVLKMIELPDWAPNKKYYNKNFPPYLIIICR
ncbi:MAG: hypothetical protein STSR0008_18290 [Ignavibacterium sp.]